MGLFTYSSIPGKLGIRNSKDDTMECLSIIVRLTCFKYRVMTISSGFNIMESKIQLLD